MVRICAKNFFYLPLPQLLLPLGVWKCRPLCPLLRPAVNQATSKCLQGSSLFQIFLEKALYLCVLLLAGPPQGCVLREVLEQHGHRLCLDRQPAQAVEHQPDSLCQVPAQLLSLIFHRDLSTFTVPGARNILIWYFIHFRFSGNKRLNLFEGRSRAM